jgi:hypothetical protein
LPYQKVKIFYHIQNQLIMKRSAYFLLLTATLFLTSCATVYRPNMTPTPLFTEKGQVAFEGAYSRDGINVSAAAAVAPNFSLMLNGQFNKDAKRGGGTVDNFPANGNYGEFGLGFYQKVEEKFVFETYLGIGRGRMEDQSKIVDNIYKESFQYNKFFLQPNLGLRMSEDFDLIFTPRIAYVTGTYANYDTQLPTDADKSKQNFFSLEPTLTMAYGTKQWKGYFQGGLNWNKDFIAQTSLFNIGAGLKYTFLAKAKK